LSDLGRLDVCLCVESAAVSLAFYEKLGFVLAEGAASEGWAVVTLGHARIGLFEKQFMGEDEFSLNFRDGDIPKIANLIEGKGIQADVRFLGSAGGSIRLRDPDGHLIFFDSVS
jgi:hypothetical protein